jgi:hypothetical protein
MKIFFGSWGILTTPPPQRALFGAFSNHVWFCMGMVQLDFACFAKGFFL